jgi:hypothetical protein
VFFSAVLLIDHIELSQKGSPSGASFVGFTVVLQGLEDVDELLWQVKRGCYHFIIEKKLAGPWALG